ncbi:hypothetical protein CYY_005035 [Polysphondylium violaceum]|uniref:3-beta hydroxysteroid dehydrogenase/isomerase domain-containing protein n=1 Tax=Polysphondylium violaceum TaxID=133409 RepID=A0A8J4UYV4_9MYCE|nr:hypothetical protein CYY_005035 [Polysphondylium violaceum]
MKNVFLTGGTGFVGKYIIEELIREGYNVRALSRSRESDRTLREMGCDPVHCSLDKPETLEMGVRGCDIVIHCAAKLETNADSVQELYRDNVQGTENLFQVSKRDNVRVFIFISSEGVIMNGQHINNADEQIPIPPLNTLGWYNESKALSEQYINNNRTNLMKSIIIRLPLVWGARDNVLDYLVGLCNKFQWFWIGGGKNYLSILHAKNAAHGIRLAIEKGEDGETYFLSDGEPVQYQRFFTDRFKQKGVQTWKLKMSLPIWFAWFLVFCFSLIWKVFKLKGLPLLTKTGLIYSSKNFTLNDSKARKKLGYSNIVSYEQGMKEL